MARDVDIGTPNLIDNAEIHGNIAVLQHHLHSRLRVYPREPSAAITLTANAVADTFGAWTELIPITTVDFIYKVIGLVIETASGATTYLIELGFSTAAGSEPTVAQKLGERRFLIPASPVVQATEVLDFYSMECPANAKLWGRVKSASSNADALGVSVALVRHIEITNPIDHLATWPWST